MTEYKIPGNINTNDKGILGAMFPSSPKLKCQNQEQKKDMLKCIRICYHFAQSGMVFSSL